MKSIVKCCCRILIVNLPIVLAIAIITSSNYDSATAGRRSRCFTSCQPVQHVQHVQHVAQPVIQRQVETKVENQTTVVNNLVGIPVPVTYNEPITAQGSTVYGYSALSDSYSNIDLGLLYNQAARLTDQAQQLAGQAHMDFSAIVQSEGQNRAEVAKILAQGQAAREALSASRGSELQPITKSFAFKVSQGSNGELKVEKIEKTSGSEPENFDLATPDIKDVSQLLNNKCVSCHNSNNAQGGLNLLGEISEDQQDSILKRVTTDNLDKRMPRNSDGAGQKLSIDELSVLFRAMGK